MEFMSDERLSMTTDSPDYVTLTTLCEMLSISMATGRNWVKLGRLIPERVEKKRPLFTLDYVKRMKEEIRSGNIGALRSRRNKKYISGNAFYHSYVSGNCAGVAELQKLLALVEECGIELSEKVIRTILADCSLHLFASKNHLDFAKERNLISLFLDRRIETGKYDSLIRDLMGEEADAKEICAAYPMLFSLDYRYEPYEDILGLIYLSCKNIADRKAAGSYYTSAKIVKQLIGHLEIKEGDRILDPCCGTGNFLLQLPQTVQFRDVYGNDIDAICVMLTRLNMALRFSGTEIGDIREHITGKDYLLEESEKDYDFIVGNPPWGYEFSGKEAGELRRKFDSAAGKIIESYDVFTEQALNHLTVGGKMSFVLPEAVLNVRAHKPLREYIRKQNSIRQLEYLGNAFDGVQCPCIILQIEHTGRAFDTAGMKVSDGKKSFVIHTKREVSSEYFSFMTDDEEYNIIRKIENVENAVYLKSNADFALGIVTGNNQEYLSAVKTKENEMVLKGSDIRKYHINRTDHYIAFRPENFQQVAPAELYRAKEKLVYRFICSQLVFAYDDKQTLSLNSCNIVIPRIEGLQVKYILAVLNSRVAQYLFRETFHSVKVLRSHIERIPIPYADAGVQSDIVNMVEPLVEGLEVGETTKAYDELDEKISSLYGLSKAETEIIKKSVDKENKFLV